MTKIKLIIFCCVVIYFVAGILLHIYYKYKIKKLENQKKELQQETQKWKSMALRIQTNQQKIKKEAANAKQKKEDVGNIANTVDKFNAINSGLQNNTTNNRR